MNGTTSARPIISRFRFIGLVLGLWGALVLLFAAPLGLTGRVSWREAASFAASFWALWLFFLPVAAWLSFRFPFERKNLFRNVGFHLLACLLIVSTNRATLHALAPGSPQAQRSDRPGRPPGPRTEMLGPPSALGVFVGLRAVLDVLVYWSVVGVCQAIANFRTSQERERRAAELEARLTSAKLQALRMQLNPHFLFNTLNSIAALVYVNPRAADEMLGDLSQLLRRSLNSMEEQEISLAQELEFVGAYIRIEQKRFGERLGLEQSVPAELMDALVPALLLQPLVENAIRHGIEPQRAPGLVTIQARRQGQELLLLVGDNGNGCTTGEPNGSEHSGIGLANTKARLRELYGPNHLFVFARGQPRGCTVEIHLPFHTKSVSRWQEATVKS